jgi:hypothetical protein
MSHEVQLTTGNVFQALILPKQQIEGQAIDDPK